MKKMFAFLMIAAVVALPAFAEPSPIAPEIDPSSGATALALLSGAVLVLRTRRK